MMEAWPFLPINRAGRDLLEKCYGIVGCLVQIVKKSTDKPQTCRGSEGFTTKEHLGGIITHATIIESDF